MTDLSKYIQSLFNKFIRHAHHAAKDFDAGEIHKMRVSFKKIEAVFNLLHFFLPGNLNEDEILKAKKCFKKAGKIRELQLMVERINSVETKSEEAKKVALDYLKKKEEKAEKKFHHYFKGGGEKEIQEVKRKMMEGAEEIRSLDLLRYFKNISEKIVLIQSNSNRNEDELHQLRKLIKELSYNRKLLSDEERKKIDSVFPSASYNRLERLIGEWHDETIFVDGIKKAEARLLMDVTEPDKQTKQKEFFAELHNGSGKTLQQQLEKIERSIRRKNSKDAINSIVL